MRFIQEDFAPGTGLKFLGDLHKTVTYALQNRDESPFQPEPIDSAAQDNMALARATQDVIGQSIRKSWWCMTHIIDRARDTHPVDLETCVNLWAGTPEMMYGSGLSLLVAWQADIPQDRYLEMARRYYDTPKPLLPAPDDPTQSVLRHAATRAFKDILSMVQDLEAARADPVFSRALDESKTWPDTQAYFAQHPDPRVSLLVSGIQKQMPDLFAAIYAVNHYLASATTGQTQEAGYVDLENALHSIQRIGAAVPVTAESSHTLGKTIQEIRNSLPVQFTVPERLQAIIQRIFEQDRAREADARKLSAGETPMPDVVPVTQAIQPEKAAEPQRESPLPTPPKRPKGP